MSTEHHRKAIAEDLDLVVGLARDRGMEDAAALIHYVAKAIEMGNERHIIDTLRLATEVARGKLKKWSEEN